MDIIGPLPVIENGNKYNIVVGDYFSKWKDACPVPNHTAMTVADKLIIKFMFFYLYVQKYSAEYLMLYTSTM